MGTNGSDNFGAGHTTGAGLETMGSNGFGNFWAGHPLGQRWGSNGKQWIW